ncbi:MAG: hypothetical protein IJS28_07015 [Synergistaceae bacterium]|nr:hypothetical protein [Synergistaceae bacterium]
MMTDNQQLLLFVSEPDVRQYDFTMLDKTFRRCPKCNSQGRIYLVTSPDGTKGYSSACLKCWGTHDISRTYEEALSMWNRRKENG